MDKIFDRESSIFGSEFTDPILVGINEANVNKELRLASSIESNSETGELQVPELNEGENELLLPLQRPEVLEVGLYVSNSPSGEEDLIIGEENEPTIEENDSLTNHNNPKTRTQRRAGNTLSTARNIGRLSGSRDFEDFVGGTDRNDYYRFTLDNRSELDLDLDDLSANANLQLLRNNGSVISTSRRGGSNEESISETLNAGTYFVRVFSVGNANTDYDLDLSVEVVGAPDLAGNNRGNARNIGRLSGSRDFEDFVGGTDRNDYYRFTLDNRSELDLDLDDLSANANLQLLRNNGSVISTSRRGGSNEESISETLNAGTYFVRVFSVGNANTDYDLDLSVEVVGAPDLAGNNRGNARNIGRLSGSRDFEDFVGGTDRNDYYRFTLDNRSELDLDLDDLSANANLQLLRNNGSVISTSRRGGSNEESISETLNAGTYFVRVFSVGNANTDYDLDLSVEVVGAPDLAGNNRGNARNIGRLSGSRDFEDFVGETDRNDYYRFTLDNRSELDLDLDDLSANANLQLLRNNGSVISTSRRGGSNEESISETLNAGTYFVRVFSVGNANTDYDLDLSVEVVGAPDLAGNNRGNARNIGRLSGSRDFEDFVGETDRNDYYRFTLDNRSELDLDLDDLSANANLQLLRNNGSVISTSRRGGSNEESISETLNAGTYFVRVFSVGNANTDYDLDLSVEVVGAPDLAGNNRGNARNIGRLSGSRDFEDFVGETDRNDYYRFTLDNRSELDLDLDDLSANANLQLLRNNGSVISTSRRGGSNEESISQTLNAGTYFVRVFSVGNANTDYDLDLSVEVV
ncbi:pre-peptidase C-terminal domain-containing protein [Okeania sp. KiyG1]|uniref:pre-peptidase C-terminal domain-containing protein n=1 Tax=Okeania sp. KiyG1 TaxID=2720165 RepID=UPI001923853E|nr:pre-peptidase C-terminal domain-containing protein [Okeania sp. KiyG1]